MNFLSWKTGNFTACVSPSTLFNIEFSLPIRKFADIANTVQQQFHGGLLKISEWADLITAHALPGPEMITHLFGDSTENHRSCGCVLILEMSTKHALTTSDYIKGIHFATIFL